MQPGHGYELCVSTERAHYLPLCMVRRTILPPTSLPGNPKCPKSSQCMCSTSARGRVCMQDYGTEEGHVPPCMGRNDLVNVAPRHTQAPSTSVLILLLLAGLASFCTAWGQLRRAHCECLPHSSIPHRANSAHILHPPAPPCTFSSVL